MLFFQKHDFASCTRFSGQETTYLFQQNLHVSVKKNNHEVLDEFHVFFCFIASIHQFILFRNKHSGQKEFYCSTLLRRSLQAARDGDDGPHTFPEQFRQHDGHTELLVGPALAPIGPPPADARGSP